MNSMQVELRPRQLTDSLSIFRIRSRCAGNALFGALHLEFSRREVLQEADPALLAPPYVLQLACTHYSFRPSTST